MRVLRKSLPIHPRYAISCLLALGFLIGSQRVECQQIAITFDDLPAHSVLPPGETRMEIARAVVKALQDAHVPPTYGFVNGVRIEESPGDAEVLNVWRAAGNPLGNHTWSHMNLNDHALEDFESDVLRNEPVISTRMSTGDWRWLRFPYLAEGDTAAKRNGARSFLQKHGYKIAAVTMSFGDYLWNEPYARCVAKNDAVSIQKLETTYLEAAASDADYRRQVSKTLFGHDIPYVLLMHIGAFDARMLPRLLALYKQKGFSFVSLEGAESDPFYANDLHLRLPGEPGSLEGLMAVRHLSLSGPRIAPANDMCR
jgi:peptidoglycan/xylan/chitin deacetylase (PgdA/CDA1 family)